MLPVLFTTASSLTPESLRASAQAPRMKSIVSFRVSEEGDGTRVFITGDVSLNDYTAYRDGESYYLTIPHASASFIQSNWTGRGFTDVLVSSRDTDLVFSFRLRESAAARVEQRLNKIEVVFTLPLPMSRPRIVESPATSPLPLNSARASAVTYVPRTASPPKLQDFLEQRAPKNLAVIKDFRQRTPGDGVPASLQTTAYLSYDDKQLYVVFVCKDDPQKVRARLSKREDISDDDLVGITLDTFHDRRRAYNFSVNPLGIQLDSIYTEGQGDDYSFDTLWYSEGQLTEDGFIVRMSIPFKSLRFSSSDAQSWGIALSRSIPRLSETSYWPYVTDRVGGFVQQLGTLEGLRDISPGRNVQVTPYGLVASSRVLDDTQAGAPAYSRDNEIRGGVDAKVILKDALTLDMTVNPDFSQVESDEPQVLVNQRFEVFFPEKRPFFIENAGFFQTPETLFFSRRVVNPQLGARLTGKLGRWTFGGLVMDDRARGRLLAEDDPFFKRRALVGVARVQREFGEQSSVGVLVTGYDFASSSNQVFSLDTRLKLNQNWTFTGQAARSRYLGLAGERLSGSLLYSDLTREGRNFNYSAYYVDRSPGFRSELGFIPRVDIREAGQYASYRWRPNKYHIISFGPSAFGSANWDRRGRLQEWSANAEFQIELTGLTTLQVGHSDYFTLFLDRGYRTSGTSLFFYTQWLDWLSLSASYNTGTDVNYFPAQGLEPFRAVSSGGSLGLTLRPSTRMRLDQTYIYSRLGRSTDPMVLASFGPASIFNNHILRSKLNYQFTRELSLRAILDYNAVLANSFLVSLDRDKSLTADLLLTYLLNPGTAVYVGYTDGYSNIALAPYTSGLPVRQRLPVTSTGRQFFVKLSYLLRY
ncbi:MAG TPA: DUF5916 domain-containing protein [Pyrinomonadaceae bacterium]|nr:DUF5916 domain-containing protein [Pyrinomonadaceae bacterium]